MEVRCHPAPARRNVLALDSGVFGWNQRTLCSPEMPPSFAKREWYSKPSLKSRVERASQVREKHCCWETRSRRLLEVQSASMRWELNATSRHGPMLTHACLSCQRPNQRSAHYLGHDLACHVDAQNSPAALQGEG